jgi:hypothetical protein
MKKALSVLVLVFCLASPAFSQIRMGGWGRIVWLPVFIDQEGEPRSVLQSPWGEEPGFEFMLTAASTNIGVDVGILVEKGLLEKGQFNQIANAKVWWSPNRYFKLHLGAGRAAALRGKFYSSSGAYSYARGRHTGITSQAGDNEPIVKIDDGDGIFSRFNVSRLGVITEITPMPGLYVGAAIMPEYKGNKGNTAEDVYKGVHAAVGYEIRGIGHARVGYVGGGAGDGTIANPSRNNDFSLDKRLEAAFALTALPGGFFADIGMKYSLEKHPGTIIERTGFCLENPLYIAMGIMYSGIPSLKIGLAVDGHFAGTAIKGVDHGTITSAPQIAFNIYPAYDLGFCEIGGDLTYGAQFGDVKGENDKQVLGFGGYVQKNYSSGNFRVGVYANAPMDDGQKWGMTLPVWITYSF